MQGVAAYSLASHLLVSDLIFLYDTLCCSSTGRFSFSESILMRNQSKMWIGSVVYIVHFQRIWYDVDFCRLKCFLEKKYRAYRCEISWFIIYTAVVLKKLFWKHHAEQADNTWFCYNQFDSKLCENIQTAIVVAIYITFWQICFQFLRFEYI